MRSHAAIESPVNWRQFATPDAFKYEEQWIGVLLRTTTVGLAIRDRRLRYQAINKALAAIHGIPTEAHLGRSVRQIIPKLAEKVEANHERVFATGQALLENRVVGEVFAGVGHWIVDYFPMKDAAGKVQQVAAVVVEMTAQQTLSQLLGTVTGMTPGITDDGPQFQFLRDLIKLELQGLSLLGLRGAPSHKFEAVSVPLSSRQRQILQLVAEGKGNKEIASLLYISVRTV